MSYQSYEEVKELNTSILEALLSNGDAQERVWAAWAIGLRLGKKALPSVSLQANNAPDAGTRRHMVVVLAGLGQYSVLSTLATHDPDESVRGTTVQYLIRVTDQNDTEKINLIINILEKDRSPIVKQGILTNWDFDQQQIPILLLLNCARNESEDVKNTAIKQIVKNYNANDLSADQIVCILTDQTTKESIYLFSNWLLKWDLSDIRILSILKIESNLEIVLWLAFGLARAINLPKIRSRSQYLEQESASYFYDLAKNHFLSLAKAIIPQKIDPSGLIHFQKILNHFEKNMESFVEYDDGDYWDDEGINQEEHIREMELDCACIKKWLEVEAL